MGGINEDHFLAHTIGSVGCEQRQMLPVVPVMLVARLQKGKPWVVPLTLPQRQLEFCCVFLQGFRVANQLACTELQLCMDTVVLYT